MNFEESIKNVIEALRTDEDYRRSWQANIAMSFKDEFERKVTSKSTFLGDSEGVYSPDAERELIHEVANEAANNFLNLLTKE